MTTSRHPAPGLRTWRRVLLAALIVASVAGWHPFPVTVWLLPIGMVPWLLLAGGAALGISALSVRLRDLRDLVGHLLNLLFFSSPIIYSLEGLEVPEPLAVLLHLNPMVSLVEVYRDAAFTGVLAPPLEWGVALGVGVVVFVIGAAVFGRHPLALGPRLVGRLRLRHGVGPSLTLGLGVGARFGCAPLRCRSATCCLVLGFSGS